MDDDGKMFSRGGGKECGMGNISKEAGRDWWQEMPKVLYRGATCTYHGSDG